MFPTFFIFFKKISILLPLLETFYIFIKRIILLLQKRFLNFTFSKKLYSFIFSKDDTTIKKIIILFLKVFFL